MKLVFLFQIFWLFLPPLTFGDQPMPNQWLLPSLFPGVIPPYLKFANFDTTTDEVLPKFSSSNNNSNSSRSRRIPPQLRPYLIWGKTLSDSSGRRAFYEQPLLATGFAISRNESQSGGEWFAKLGNCGYTSLNHNLSSLKSSRAVAVSVPHQKYNHIPGLGAIGNKIKHWSHYKTARSTFGTTHYNYLLDSFILPSELQEFKQVWKQRADKVWIVKTPLTSRSFGIYLISHWSEVVLNSSSTFPPSRPHNNAGYHRRHAERRRQGQQHGQKRLVQTLLRTPYLVRKRKAEFRLLVLVTSISPLRLYVSYSRVAKLPTSEYNPNFDVDDIDGAVLNAKYGNRSANLELLVELEEVLEVEFGPGGKVAEFKAAFEDIIIKGLCTFQEEVSERVRQVQFNRYNSFQMLAIDFFIDSTTMKPYLIEMNGSPIPGRRPFDLAPLLTIAGFHLPPIPRSVLAAFGLNDSHTFKEDLYTFKLSGGEKRKLAQFGSALNQSSTSTSSRSTAGDKKESAILAQLTVDDVRQLMIAEDELARSLGTEWKRIYPVAAPVPAAAVGATANDYSIFMTSDLNRYYARLLHAWEESQSQGMKGRAHGIKILQSLAKEFGI